MAAFQSPLGLTSQHEQTTYIMLYGCMMVNKPNRPKSFLGRKSLEDYKQRWD